MKKTTDTSDALLHGDIFKTMLSLSVPAILGMVVIGLYNFMDAVFVGQMVGPEAMTAVKVSYPFTLLNSGIATLIGTGSSSVLSRAIGKRDQATVNKIMGNLMCMVFLLSVAITAIGLIFAPNLLAFSGAEGNVLTEATEYLRIVFWGSLFVNFGQAANMVMRGEGKLKIAMAIMAMGAILNIILDPIMITIVGADKGAAGAAFATVISQVTQALFTLWYFLKKSDNVRIGRIRIEKDLVGSVLSVGFSAMLMQVMSMFQQTIMYSTAAQYGGGQWQTILGASLSLQAFSFIPLWGISQGFQPAVGTNYGAGNFNRVKKFTMTFILSATTLAMVFYLPIMLAPKGMLSMFITDSAITTAGAPMLRLLFTSYITYGFLILAITFFQAIGKGGVAAVLALSRQLIVFLPLVVLLPKVHGLGITGIFLAQLITDFIVLILAAVFMIREFAKMKQEASVVKAAA